MTHKPIHNLGHFAHPSKKQTQPVAQIAKPRKGDKGKPSKHPAMR